MNVRSRRSTGRALLPPLLAVLLAQRSASPQTRAEPDDWPRYGHDGALTGRSSLRGDIVAPRVAWTADIAGTTHTIAILPAEGEHALEPAAAGGAREALPDWGLGPPVLDIDGSGRRVPVRESFHERWADILPDVKGLESVAWSHTWTTAKIVRLQLFAHDQGADKPRLVWQTDPPEGDIFSPLDVVSDIDGDGVLEVCVAAHYRVMVFEGTTGRKETELRYHASRPYGWMGLFDVDADGQDEIVTIGDFQSHVDVLKYDRKKPEPERLSVLWRRDIENDITLRQRWPQVGPRPVVDVTGDARLEILLNFFNPGGDGEWHLQVLDASTGDVIVDAPRRFAQGSADLDGDGKEEVFASATSGVVVPRFARIELLRCAAGKLTEVLSLDDAQWATADLPRLGAKWSTTAQDGMRNVLTSQSPGQRPAWLAWVRTPPAVGAPAGLTLRAMRLGDDGKAVDLWSVSGLEGEVQTLECAPGPGVLLEATLPHGEEVRLDGHGARALVTGKRGAGGSAAPVIACRLEAGGPPLVLAEGAGGRVFALEPPRGAESSPRIRWSARGRGMSNGSGLAGLAAADLKGDGAREVLAAGESSDGLAEVSAYGADGAVLWRAKLAGVPGPPPPWNRGGLTYFWPGRFRDKSRDDVFVSVRRGPMHSDSGVLLDGASGQVVWRRDAAEQTGEFHWGYAGSVVAAADMNGDGLDEIVNLYPVCFWTADGRTGAFTAARELASRKRVPAWAAYGEPIVHDFTGSGAREVLLDSVYILALLDRQGEPLWHGPPKPDYPSGKPEDDAGQTTGTRHALADIDGDGVPEVASAGYGDGVRVMRAKDGKVLWSLAAPAPTGAKVSACDIDGRPGDEVIYPAGDTLVAVTGDLAGGRILWTWRGPAALGLPAIADLDGDGRAEIVVRSADGVITCLDGPASQRAR